MKYVLDKIKPTNENKMANKVDLGNGFDLLFRLRKKRSQSMEFLISFFLVFKKNAFTDVFSSAAKFYPKKCIILCYQNF